MYIRLLWTATLCVALTARFSTSGLAQQRSPGARVVKTSSQVVVWRITTIGVSKKFSSAKEARERLEKKAAEVLQSLGVDAADRHHEFPIIKQTLHSGRPTRPSGYLIRRTILSLQRDVDQFDKFFQQLAALESDYLFVEFSFKPANFKLADSRRPLKSAVWKTTIVGASNRLLRARERFEQKSMEFRQVLVNLGIRPSDISATSPSMESRFSRQYPDKKPTGYRYQQTFTFKQDNLDEFQATLTNFAERESDYFYFTFTLK